MSSYPGPEALYDYELFAVINHEGQIDRGHYTSFARFQDTVRVSPLNPLSSSLPATDFCLSFNPTVVPLR